ncbi:helix-turn-helix transcriptional regulator [Sphingopyxis fribergensis]
MPKLTTPPVPRLLGSEMAAAYLGISERTLDHVRHREGFPKPLRLGRRILWDRKALDEFVDSLAPQLPDAWDGVRATA